MQCRPEGVVSQFALRCVALRCVALRCVVLRCVVLRCAALRCVALCCVALRCVALRYVALRCIGYLGWSNEKIVCYHVYVAQTMMGAGLMRKLDRAMAYTASMQKVF